jgi:ATP-dependent Clp protease ATP-binding subunit ClpC
VELLLRHIRESMAERELSLNLSDQAKDLLVEKGWDPAMGARPLRRAIQRYIEDPLADKVLSSSMEPGSTVEVDKAADGEDPEVKIEIVAPKTRKRQTVGVGAKGGEGEGEPSGDGSPDFPEDPEILPEVPDAPPADESSSEES